MSLDSETPEQPVRQLLCVVDTSALIRIKSLVPLARQWDTLHVMRGLVAAGELTFPRQVAKELSVVRYPDAPGAWVESAKGLIVYSQPSDGSLKSLFEAIDPLPLIDAESTTDPADPYVAAMAVELQEAFPARRVVVATDDVVDRLPHKIALATACSKIGVETMSPKAMIEWVDNRR